MGTLGVDLGGSSIKWIVLSDGHDVVAQGQIDTEAERGPQHVLDRIVALARSAQGEHGGVRALGLGMPGPLDLERGRAVFLANLPGWDDTPIVEPLVAALGLPVALINDARAFTLAELELGAGAGVRDMVGITLGTGVGGGVVVGGQLLLGLNGNVGEIGHQTLVPDGPPCGCGNRGCLEAFASGPAIAREAGMATPEQVFEAARSGDRRASDVLERAGAFLGIGIANILTCVGPERVVIGGGVAAAGDRILEPARRELHRRMRAVPLDRVAIVPATLGIAAGAIGAALWGARGAAELTPTGAAEAR
jgi:glucokinase